jgi:uncharacterized protein YfaS (alpha-2-macroglobulin family)
MQRLWSVLARIWIAIFGSVAWQPPSWAGKIKNKYLASRVHAIIGPRFGRARAKVAANPRRYRRIALGTLATVILVSGGGYALKRYLDSRPHPAYAKVTLDTPHARKVGEQKKAVLLVQFSLSAAPLDALNKPLAKGPELSPALKGYWFWVSDHALEFVPDAQDNEAEWAIGQKYHLSLGKGVVAPHVLLEERDFDFQTEGFTAQLSKPEFYIDPQDAKIKKVTAEIDFNYPVKTEDMKKKVHFFLQDKDAFALKPGGDSIPVHVTFNKTFEAAYLESDVLPVPAHPQVMRIAVDEELKPMAASGAPSKGELSGEVEIPGRYDGFALSDYSVIYPRNEKYEPEQVLKLETSLSADSEEVGKNLHVWLLPADHKPPGAPEEVKHYNWSSPTEVNGEVLARSKPLTFTTIPTENPVSRVHSFRMHADTNRYLLVKVAKNTRAWGDYLLQKEDEQIVPVGEYPKELSFMGDGAVLSLGGDNQLPLLSRNLSEVKFEISRILPDQVNHVLINMLSNSFKDPGVYPDLEYTIAERWEEKQKLELSSSTATQYFALNLDPYLHKGEAKRGLFLVRAFAPGVNQVMRLVLVTDLGAIAKHTNSGKTEVFAQNFRSGLPLVGAKVEIIGRNGIAVLDATTGAEGRVTFPDLKDFHNEKQPTAIVVQKGGDISYLPFKGADRELNYSRFDVGGTVESSASDQLLAMLFSDRGMYRPGESVDLGMIVRAKNWKKGAARIPITWTVTDPRGNEVKREKLEIGPSDLRALRFSTTPTSATGTYSAQVFVVQKNMPDQQIGSTTVQVQEFTPDHLRIAAALSKERASGWIAPEMLEGNVSLHNLFGTAAEDRRVEGKITLTPVAPVVKGFGDFVFANPNKRDAQVFSETLPSGKTDSGGNGKFDIDLTKYEGFFYLRFEAQGFEAEAGKGVSAATGTYVSSLPFLVGFKPEVDLSYIRRDAKTSVRLQAVDSSDKKIPVEHVKLQLVEHRFVSVLTKQDNGTYKYQSVRKDIPGNELETKIPGDGLSYALATGQPGEFTLTMRTPDGKELNHLDYSVIAEANLSRSLEKNGELQVALSKKDFKPGEEIEMQIRAPYAGAGLITIERDEVYAVKWFKTGTNATVEHIKVPEGLEGNAYVNVAMLRSVDSKEVFTNPLSAAVAPFSISLDQFKTSVKLQVPDRVKPGNELKVRYSADRATPIIVYGVDEGILQVAGYKLPNPLAFFFQKRALQVRTYQLLDLLLPDYSVLKSLSAPGGDEGGATGTNLNPFRRKGQPPVVFWSGVLEAGPGAKTFTYPVPDYFNGNLRVMAVAAAANGLGSGSADALVRGDLIITPTAPTFVSPGDEFQLGLSVSNQSDPSIASNDVRVEIETSPELTSPSTTKTQAIPKGHEGGLTFKVKATEHLGDGKIVVKASVGGASARYAVDMSVRPAVPQVTTIASGELASLPAEVKVDRSLHEEFAKRQLTLGALPLVQAFALAQYLKSYPYDCTEQLVSKGFPQLVLADRPEFGALKGGGGGWQDTVEMLRTRQTPGGGFALYGANPNTENEAATLYAIHFLSEVKSHGHPVPEPMFGKALAYLGGDRVRHAGSLGEARQFAYAVYLQARNGIVPARDLEFLRSLLEKNFPDQWKKDPAAIYLAGAYQLLKQQDAADKLISRFSVGDSTLTDYESYFDPLVEDSTLIYITAHHFPERLKGLLTLDALKKMARPLERGQFNSHSAAQVLLAFDAIMGASDLGLLHVTAEELLEGGKSKPLAVPQVALAKLNVSGGTKAVSLKGQTDRPLFYSMLQSGFDRPGFTPIRKQMEVLRRYTDENGKEVTKAKLGQELTVHVVARALDGLSHANVALVDLLPAGFEVVLENRANGGGGGDDASASADDATAGEDNGDQDRASPPSDDEGAEPAESGEGGDRAWLPPFIPRAYADEPVSSSLQPFSAQYSDYREDRVIVYGYLGSDATEFTYKIKAVNVGTYAVPAPFGESMYDRSVQFLGSPSTIEVTAP